MDLIERITKEVKPIYLTSPHYTSTIWDHALRVSKFAEELAKKMGGVNLIIVKAGGLLHDLGAGMYGQKGHHITGVKEAVVVLLKCECPLELVGPIIDSVYSHRGSMAIPFRSPEAKCVATADALDHFNNLEELWRVQIVNLKVPEMNAYHELSEKLRRDWEKIDPGMKVFVDGMYERAQEELLKLASKKRTAGKKQLSLK